MLPSAKESTKPGDYEGTLCLGLQHPLSYFIYDSKQLGELNAFVTDSRIHVMIINSQKFNATNKDARRIYMKLDDFGGSCPIDVIAQMNPILIIDEPQSVEGANKED